MSITEPARPSSGLLTTEGTPIPLLGVECCARLAGFAVEMTTAQRFRNTEKKPLEVTYLFPLPETAAVTGLSITVGSRTIRSAIAEREEAFARYDEAMSSGDGAFLLDQERPNVFHLSVGNLLPGEEAVVSIDTIFTAAPEERGVRLLVPTTISPRYTPAQLSAADRREIERTTPPYAAHVPYGFKFTLDVEMGSTIRGVSSPSHPLSVRIDGQSASVSLGQETTEIDRDLVILIETTEPRQAVATVAEMQGHDHVQVELYPDVPRETATHPRHIVFLVDCSGSMNGTSIEEARRAVELCLRQMRPGDRFQIGVFGSTHRFLFEKTQDYSQESLDRAIALVRNIAADMGGTEIHTVLELIVTTLPPAGIKTTDVIVLTDGQVANEAQVIDLVTQHAERNRIFSFGIGAGASEMLVRELARKTRGEAEFIAPGERIESKVLRQFARIDTPILTGVRIDWAGLTVEPATAEVPPVFHGQPLIARARLASGEHLNDGATITLEAGTPQGHRTWTARVRRTTTATRAVCLSWARDAIRSAETAHGATSGGPTTAAGSQQKRSGAKKKSRALELALAYELMSSETSFIAVEERDEQDKAKGPAELRQVPVAITRGWGGGALGGGAGFATGAFMTSMPAGAPAPMQKKSGGLLCRLAESVSDLQSHLFSQPERRLMHHCQEASEADMRDGGAPTAPVSPAPAAAPNKSAKRKKCDTSGSNDGWHLQAMMTQRFDGSFAEAAIPPEWLNPTLQKFMADRIGEFTASPDTVRDAVITIVVLVLLSRHAAAVADEWRGAAEKARRWLANQPLSVEGEPDLEAYFNRVLPH